MVRNATAAALVALVGVGLALGQGNEPPIVIGYRIYVNGVFATDHNNPVPVRALEQDRIRVEIDVLIPQVDEEEESEPEEVPEFFYEKISEWMPYPYGSPEGPPINLDTALNEFSPLVPYRLEHPEYSLAISFYLPEINGANQARLRGLVDYDVWYEVRIRIWNKETAGEADPVHGFSFSLYVNEDPSLKPPVPPVFADAGSDVLAALGQTVNLDARRTFDAYNVGFDPMDPNVYEKDLVIYTWQWLSGPVRNAASEPVKPDPDRQPWLAQVTPDTLGTYEYRVFVSTASNPTPRSDTVNVTVVPELPPNHAPRAVIDVPSEPVVVGQVVTLDASSSSDPDGDALTYRWRQTDEVGGVLPAEVLATTFQPLSGLQQAQSQWQAIAPGTYYFILLVNDGQAGSSARTTVTVVPTANAGESVTRDATAEQVAAPLAGVPTAGCGAGLTPLVVVPFVLLLLRGRMR